MASRRADSKRRTGGFNLYGVRPSTLEQCLAQSIHDKLEDTASRPQRQPETLCCAEVSYTAGTAALPRGGRGTAEAAGGDGGRHRTPGHGGRLPGVSSVATRAGAVVVVAASPLVPRQWRRRRRRRLCFGDELAAWPCKEIDILAKSIHSTTANCFSSWKGGFDAFPRIKGDNGNGSVAVSVCFTDRSSFRSSPDRLRAIFCKPLALGAARLPSTKERAADERRARDVVFW